jgi:hypothetical protein
LYIVVVCMYVCMVCLLIFRANCPLRGP